MQYATNTGKVVSLFSSDFYDLLHINVLKYFRGCDLCEEWYHGDCIGVTEKDAKSIKTFFCHFCRGLYTKWHSKFCLNQNPLGL